MNNTIKIFSFSVSTFLICSISHATLTMKPGLWEIKTKMVSDKGETDPMEHMRKSMEKMKPEQRRQMEEMMSKQGVGLGGGMGGGGMKICYTAELLKNNESLMGQQKNDSKCKTKITTQSTTKTAMEYKCEDGSFGTGEWTFESKEKYKGAMKMTSSKGKKSEIKHEAKFISANCGSVKPLLMPDKKM